MWRRQLISDELRYSHQTSPRKTRTLRSGGVFLPTILYRNDMEVDMTNNWVGKEFIPWNGEFILPYVRSVYLMKNNPNIVSEFEIANFAKPNIYRVLYVIIDPRTGKLIMKSKPSVEYEPGRLNVLLTPDNIIRKIAYF